jgi:hypothetical protein
MVVYSSQICNKLYTALPKKTRAELKDIYESHKERLNIKIFCGFQNRLSMCFKYNIDNPRI